MEAPSIANEVRLGGEVHCADFEEWYLRMLSETMADIHTNPLWCVRYDNARPFDSWDRLLCLYIKERCQDFLEAYNEKMADNSEEYLIEKTQEFDKKYSNLSSDVTVHAFGNYERENMADYEALYKVLAYAKNETMEFIMEDAYEDGGWFGAS